MKIIRRCVYTIETCLILFGIIFILGKFGGINLYVVLSGSMEPAIKTGSLVLIDTGEKDYKVGDIITYKVEDQLVTHRIVEISMNIYRTKGDANEKEDSVSLLKSNIVGKVKISIPILGYLIAFMQSKIILLILLAVVFLANLFDILSKNNSQKILNNNF